MKNFSLLKKINMADAITLLGLIPLMLAFHFTLADQPFRAIIAICIVFLFDVLDGYVARKLNISSDFGRQLDSFLDFFNYLIFSCFFIYQFLNFNSHITILVIFIILAMGTLRLARHNLAGLSTKNNSLYYTGLIVPYIQLSTITIFFATIYISINIQYLLLPILTVISFFMISDFKMRKVKNYFIISLLIIFIISLSLMNIF